MVVVCIHTQNKRTYIDDWHAHYSLRFSPKSAIYELLLALRCFVNTCPDLIIIQSVWNDMKKQNQLRQTKSRRTVATSPRCFKRPTCKANTGKSFKNAVIMLSNNVINRFLYLLTQLNQHLVWPSFEFKTAFALGALVQSFFQVALPYIYLI